ncbi:hypothetical protein F5Y03DRAFT_367800 [Xylaria venustula]|nr:hypothetical protein F5Y03DRAFT_367800 [Xylaria venustula]
MLTGYSSATFNIEFDQLSSVLFSFYSFYSWSQSTTIGVNATISHRTTTGNMVNTHSNVARWQYDLLPHIVDRISRNTPNVSYGLWLTSSTSYEEGYQTDTYSQLANAVDSLAWWLVDHLGQGHGDVIACQSESYLYFQVSNINLLVV